MLLTEITLFNFRQFKGKQTITFSNDTDRNVTVIIGENGSGKTTLAQAFTWCLYGETDFKNKGIRTRRGAFFSSTQMHQILTSPYCVEATPEVYDFFESKGCQMDPDSPREKWDGSVGVMVYGRTTEKNKKHQKQPPEKWLVCLGKHEPFIPAEKWLEVQSRFAKNKFDKTMKYDIPLLKGVLRCSCGSIMQVARKKKASGGVLSSYYCIKRSRQGREYCDSHQIKCDKLDNMVLEILQSIHHDHDVLQNFIKEDVEILDAPDPKQTASKVSACEAKIERLAASLAIASDSPAQKYIVAEIERLDMELQALKREHSIAIASEHKRSSSRHDAEAKADEISRMMSNLDSFSASEKNEIVRSILKDCIWDGESLFITL